ncbi:MAG: response regulator transcription factor, partial [Ignavibacteria bacterium]|nr:response regulator transcription factor [Ignavibacteria bacterium]
LMDIDMPSLDGIKTTSLIRSQFRKIKILILSNHIEAHLIQRALKSGANGYLSKFSEANEVVEAIQTVFKGETYYCKASMKAIMEQITVSDKTKNFRSAYLELTSREKEVLSLIANEFSTKDISDKLVISIRTVETHRRNIMRKLCVKNTAGMMKLSLEHNLIHEEI